MKKTKIVYMALFIGVILLLNGCASTGPTQGYADTIEEAHPDRFEKTVIGMDINEFKTIWPEATRSGVSEGSETYEFIYTRLSGYMNSYNFKIYLHFYFINNQLVKYESEKKII